MLKLLFFDKRFKGAKKWAILWNTVLDKLPSKYWVKYVRNVWTGKYCNR